MSDLTYSSGQTKLGVGENEIVPTQREIEVFKKLIGDPLFNVSDTKFPSWMVDTVARYGLPVPIGNVIGYQRAFAVEATVADLGTPSGVYQQAMIRAGAASPYTYQKLIYDPLDAKWIGEVMQIMTPTYTQTGAGGNSTVTVASTTTFHKALIDAGLSLQFRYVGSIRVTVGTATLQVAGTAYSDGDTAAGSTATAALFSGASVTATTWKDSGWVSGPSLATPETMIELKLQIAQTGAGYDAFATGMLLGRWIA